MNVGLAVLNKLALIKIKNLTKSKKISTTSMGM